MAKLKSELEVTCPCCNTVLVIDTNLGRIISHREVDRGDKPELDDAARILAAAVALSRAGKLPRPDDQIVEPRPK